VKKIVHKIAADLQVVVLSREQGIHFGDQLEIYVIASEEEVLQSGIVSTDQHIV